MDLNTQLTKFLSGGNLINYTDFGSLEQTLTPARQGKDRQLAARAAFDKQIAFPRM
jgi:nucleoid DNA-binding protein